MNRYAICFDLPDIDDPWFAILMDEGPGLTRNLEHASRFPSEEIAEGWLVNGYGRGINKWGTVVEVAP